MYKQYNCYLSTDGIAKTGAAFGQGAGTIAIENVACTGTESQLLACSSSVIFNTGTCRHSEDAGVVCEGEFSRNRSQYLYH